MTEPTLTQIATSLNSIIAFLEMLDEKIDALQESVDLVDGRIDEINLPVGSGFDLES